MRYSKVVIAIIILLNASFAYKVLEVYETTGSEPTALIGCWFAFTTGELWMIANVTKNKIKKKKEEDKNAQD